jgi:hypothetical protein
MARNGRPNAIPETEAGEQKEDHAPVDGHCRLFPMVTKSMESQSFSSFSGLSRPRPALPFNLGTSMDGFAWARLPHFAPIERGVEATRLQGRVRKCPLRWHCGVVD